MKSILSNVFCINNEPPIVSAIVYYSGFYKIPAYLVRVNKGTFETTFETTFAPIHKNVVPSICGSKLIFLLL